MIGNKHPPDCYLFICAGTVFAHILVSREERKAVIGYSIKSQIHEKIYFLSLILLLFGANDLLSAKNLQVKGRIIDSVSNQPLQFATLAVSDSLNNSMFYGIIENEDGSFLFKNIKVESSAFKIIISYVGYETYIETFNTDQQERSIDLGDIKLSPQGYSLSELVVKAPSYRQSVDRTTYIIDSSYLEGVAVSLDLLRKIPELNVNLLRRNVSIKGGDKTLVLVNGVNTGESIDLRTINYRDIDKIDVITTPSSGAQMGYDGIVNIILKPDVRKGFSFDTEVTAKIDGRSADAYVGMIWGAGKFRINLSYDNYYRANRFLHIDTRTDNITGDIYNTIGNAPRPRENSNTLNLKVDYQISPRDFLNISTRTGLFRTNKSIDNIPTLTKNGITQNLTNFTNKDRSESTIGNYTLYYLRKLSETKTHTISFNTNFSFMDANEFSSARYDDGKLILNNETADRYTLNFLVDYSNPISKNFTLNTGVQGYYQRFKGLLDNEVNGNSLKNYRFNGYSDLIFKLNSYQLLVGVKVEANINDFDNPTYGSVRQTIIQPQVRLLRKINHTNTISLAYRRLPLYISSWLLTPYEIRIDEKTTLKGNPGLKPQVYDIIQLAHQFRKGENFVNSILYYQRGNKLISMVKSYDSDLNVISSPVNSGKSDKVGLRLSGSFTLAGFIEFETDMDLFYQKLKINGIARHIRSMRASGDLTFALPANFAIGAYGSFTGRRLTTMGHIEPIFELEALYLFKYFKKIDLKIILAYQNLIESSEIEYDFSDNFTQKDYFKFRAKGLILRVSYFFNTGNKQKLETFKTYYDVDKK